MKRSLPSIIILLFLLLVLPLTLYLAKTVQQYLSKAAFSPANIIIDANKSFGLLPTPWRALAQGGEIEEDGQPVFFSDVIDQLSSLSPKYIRIDHIYDFYQVVSRNSDGSLSYNFTLLDRVVNDILKTGSLPFFSLSYMPSVIAHNGNIIGQPSSWNDWQEVVKKTVEHYSGQNQKNLKEVYYEVWNEPDLFGNWKIGGPKDYQLLYQYAVYGATSAFNVNSFKIGGPATTQPLKVWTDDFLSFIERNNLRLDFYSWHRYSFDPQQFDRDVVNINRWLSLHPKYQNITKIISEWGSDSENNPVHDSSFDAIYTLAVIRQIIDKVNLAFTFEIKDGIDPQGKKFWGRWGIFTHHKYGVTAKPRYSALLFLENLKGERVSLAGEGSDVTGLAVKNESLFKVLLINYKNSRSDQQEAVPIKIINLPKGIYSYKENYFGGKTNTGALKMKNGVLEKTLFLPANQAMIFEVSKVSDLVALEPGRFGYTGDQALVLDKDNPALNLTINRNLAAGTVEFWLKNDFNGAALAEQFFLDIPLKDGLNLTAKKDLFGFGTVIKYGFFESGKGIDILTYNITHWQPGEWHYLSFSWQTEPDNNLKLKFFIDGTINEKVFKNRKIDIVANIIVGGYQGSLEELRISSLDRNPGAYYPSRLSTDEGTIILKHFDGSL